MELPETANKVQLLVTRTEASQNRETLYVIIYRGGDVNQSLEDVK